MNTKGAIWTFPFIESKSRIPIQFINNVKEKYKMQPTLDIPKHDITNFLYISRSKF